jgi:hypothetical protein
MVLWCVSVCHRKKEKADTQTTKNTSKPPITDHHTILLEKNKYLENGRNFSFFRGRVKKRPLLHQKARNQQSIVT